MAVLETTIKRFIGHSSDPKPTIGRQVHDAQTTDDSTTVPKDLPAGSTFFEEDTGDIWRWNGAQWKLPLVEDSQREVMQGLTLLNEEIRLLRIGMIAAGTCKQIKKH